ncbi:AFG1-like ATPase-domain-containing protein [Bombardia bombarda]|uniref:AFG1-like ATPase-domain-containing protein n=1 Tax=Bombardia bombarda TaxID=252184 RepID=A0AA39WGL3_9PEZI|nr:AFG1-like ATPase-domain-containing protein [Bombardia bombarda]
MGRFATVTSVAITDPLVKYTSLVATGVYSPDIAQHRLAHHLQKLYLSLKDYTPAQEYRARLRKVTELLDSAKAADGEKNVLASPSHPIRRNPLFARFFRSSEGRDALALTRVMTSHQAALHVDSPKGLFLSGEVGTGKSMLLDLLADGLPTQRKKRWHFNNFMLHTFSRLEQFRKSRPQATGGADSEPDYSLLWMAKDMVEKTPILFLDEFQLPDRAASKIMNNLLIAFFQLGGVLIASSNRMPEGLEKATGLHYTPPSAGGLVRQASGLGKRQPVGELYGQTSDFSAFLDVLKARCDFWHMEGAQDWRRRESHGSSVTVTSDSPSSTQSLLQVPWPESRVSDLEPDADSLLIPGRGSIQQSSERPVMYFLPSDSDEKWTEVVQKVADIANDDPKPWKPSALIVYGRKVIVPRQHDGFAYWNFSELVSGFGPADYITLASSYHTFFIDQVPLLTMSMKNEARRFITLLDALYESRCKLIIRAEAGPDGLFFPETRKRPTSSADDAKEAATAPRPDESGDDATYSETIAEVFQDQMSPFRPNISSYSDSPNAKYNPDQDSDFGLDPGNTDKRVDFRETGAFTGEDERFAYKRATSRLWELCGSQWHSRTSDWWQPLPVEARHWEGVEPSKPLSLDRRVGSKSEIRMGSSTELAEPAGLERFRIALLKKNEG